MKEFYAQYGDSENSREENCLIKGKQKMAMEEGWTTTPWPGLGERDCVLFGEDEDCGVCPPKGMNEIGGGAFPPLTAFLDSSIVILWILKHNIPNIIFANKSSPKKTI